MWLTLLVRTGACVFLFSGMPAYGTSPADEPVEESTGTAGPLRGQGKPEGVQAKGLTVVTLSLETDSASVCRWSPTSGAPYDEMASAFMSTGGLRHQYPLKGLGPGKQTYYVRCKDASGGVNPDDFPITFTVPDVTPPSRPNGFTAQSLGSGQISLRWEPADDDVGVVKYLVYKGAIQTAAVKAPSTTHKESGLNPDQLFIFQLRAMDAAGNVSTPATASGTTGPGADTGGPVVTGVEAVDVGPGSASIFWNTDEPADSAVDYGLTAGHGQAAVDKNLTTTHEMLLSGLRPGTEYHFRVRSRDAQGNLRVSGGHRFTTAPGALAEAPAEEAGAQAYPNPWRTGRGAASMTLRNLPIKETVRIFTMAGSLIKTLTVDLDGTAHWDGTDQAGQRVETGVYLAVCGSTMLKVMAQN